jgi:hypothetical protein
VLLVPSRRSRGTPFAFGNLQLPARLIRSPVIVPIQLARVGALGAHVLSRWMPYQVYRRTSASWPNDRPELVRLISFVLLSLMIVCSLGLPILLTWSALALLLWNRTRLDIYALFNSARRLDRCSRPATAQRRERDPASPHETAQ